MVCDVEKFNRGFGKRLVASVKKSCLDISRNFPRPNNEFNCRRMEMYNIRTLILSCLKYCELDKVMDKMIAESFPLMEERSKGRIND